MTSPTPDPEPTRDPVHETPEEFDGTGDQDAEPPSPTGEKPDGDDAA